MENDIGYLGPAGTFCEDAAEKVFPDHPRKAYPNLISIIEAVESGALSTGVLPMENLLEGTVVPVLDGLTCHPGTKICGEFVMPIHHHLMANQGIDLPDIAAVLSHAHALAQCQNFLRKNLAAVPCYPVASTAEAARTVALELRSCAAIGNERAANLYGLNILVKNISDIEKNFTRFIILSRGTPPPTGNDKTSLAFSLEHKPGTLAQVLTLFAEAEINLTKIESRPSRKVFGEYIFYVDLEGHVQDQNLCLVCTQLKKLTSDLLILGSYPKKL